MMAKKDNTGMRIVMALIASAILLLLYSSPASASSTGTTVYYTILPNITYGVDVYSTQNLSVTAGSNATYTVIIVNNGSVSDNYTLSVQNIDGIGIAELNQTAVYNLPSGESYNITLTVGDASPGNYTVNVTATSQGNSSVNDHASVETEVRPKALIVNTSLSPYAVINGSNVSLYVDAENFEAVWAVITRPDSSNETVMLTDEANTIYGNTGLPGIYNVTFYANNSLGDIVSAKDYFEAFNGILIRFDIVNSTILGVNSTFVSYYRNGSVAINSSANGTYIIRLANTTLDTEFYAHDNRIRVTVWNTNITDINNKQIGLDKNNMTSGYLVTYGVEPEWNTTDATVRIYYTDLTYSDESRLRLYKCDDYNFTGQTCNGVWNDVTSQSTQDQTSHYFQLHVTSFSGFSIKEEAAPSPLPPGGGGGGGGKETPTQCIENWKCGPWSTCINGAQTRTCIDMNNCDTTEYMPVTRFPCFVYCTPQWNCTDWGECNPDGTRMRDCADIKDCSTRRGMPSTTQSCEYYHCADRVQNFGEEEIDCGGRCPECAVMDRPRLVEFAEANILCLLIPLLVVILLVMVLLVRASNLPKEITKRMGIINLAFMLALLAMLIPTNRCPYGACMKIADQMPIMQEILLFLFVMFFIVLSEGILYFAIKRRHLTEGRMPGHESHLMATMASAAMLIAVLTLSWLIKSSNTPEIAQAARLVLYLLLIALILVAVMSAERGMRGREKAGQKPVPEPVPKQEVKKKPLWHMPRISIGMSIIKTAVVIGATLAALALLYVLAGLYSTAPVFRDIALLTLYFIAGTASLAIIFMLLRKRQAKQQIRIPRKLPKIEIPHKPRPATRKTTGRITRIIGSAGSAITGTARRAGMKTASMVRRMTKHIRMSLTAYIIMEKEKNVMQKLEDAKKKEEERRASAKKDLDKLELMLKEQQGRLDEAESFLKAASDKLDRKTEEKKNILSSLSQIQRQMKQVKLSPETEKEIKTEIARIETGIKDIDSGIAALGKEKDEAAQKKAKISYEKKLTENAIKEQRRKLHA